MRFVFTIIFLFSSFAFSQEIVKVKETNLDVAIGIDQIVRLEYKLHKVKYPRSDIVSVNLDKAKQTLTFVGLKAGRVSVTVFDAAGNPKDKFIVNVTSDGKSDTVRKLRELMGDIEGLKIGIKGGNVVVEGEIVVPDKIGKVMTVVSKFPEVMLLIEYSKFYHGK